MTKTPVNGIEIPAHFVALCEGWHGGIDDFLYAVASTGNLTIGTRRPMGCDSDEKWYLTLWSCFANDIGFAVRSAEKGLNAEDDGGDGAGHDADYPELVEFEAYADGIVELLEREYNLADWDASDDGDDDNDVCPYCGRTDCTDESGCPGYIGDVDGLLRNASNG